MTILIIALFAYLVGLFVSSALFARLDARNAKPSTTFVLGVSIFWPLTLVAMFLIAAWTLIYGEPKR